MDIPLISRLVSFVSGETVSLRLKIMLCVCRVYTFIQNSDHFFHSSRIVSDGGIFNDGGMCCRYYQSFFPIFQLGFSLFARPNMEIDN